MYLAGRSRQAPQGVAAGYRAPGEKGEAARPEDRRPRARSAQRRGRVHAGTGWKTSKMSGLTDEICALIDGSSEEERRLVFTYLRQRVQLHPLEEEWATTAEAILTAIARSRDLTLRGIRGILAEATFAEIILPRLESEGWNVIAIVGDQAYDFLLERDGVRIRIQVKLQRKEKGVPKEYAMRSRAGLNCPPGTIHVVEVQKTRSGQEKDLKTRPYRYGDFDILAVNLHPFNRGLEPFRIHSWQVALAEQEATGVNRDLPARSGPPGRVLDR